MSTPLRPNLLSCATVLLVTGAAVGAACSPSKGGGAKRGAGTHAGASAADAGATADAGDMDTFSRPLPPASRTVAVWSDQLDKDLTDAQIRFAAEHLVGSQKLAASTSARLRAINPGFLVLQYRLASGLSTVPNLVGRDAWIRDTLEPGAPPSAGMTAPEESYYLHAPPKDGPRVVHADGYFLADVRNEAWQKWQTAEIMRRMPLNDFDGVFLDTSHLRTDGFTPDDWYKSFCDPDVTHLANCWTPPATETFQTLVATLHGGPVRYHAIGNFGPLTTIWDPDDYLSPLDGGMIELFMWQHGPLNEADWHISAARILKLCGNDRVMIAQPVGVPLADGEGRRFVLGSFLLLQGHHGFASFYPEGTESVGAPVWLPEYDLDLGRPVEPLPATLGALCSAGATARSCEGVYTRRYERGLVYVNPADAARTITLPAPPAGKRWVDLGFTGGGYVDAAGKPASGEIVQSESPQSEFSVSPHGARIFRMIPR